MDLTNDILCDEIWDSKTAHSPLNPYFQPNKIKYQKDTPYGTAPAIVFHVPFYPTIADVCINDLITSMLDEAG